MPKKPTIRELKTEIEYLGQRLMMTEQVLQNTVKIVDLYISYRKQDKKFKKHVIDLTAKAQKDLKDKIKK